MMVPQPVVAVELKGESMGKGEPKTKWYQAAAPVIACGAGPRHPP